MIVKIFNNFVKDSTQIVERSTIVIYNIDIDNIKEIN